MDLSVRYPPVSPSAPKPEWSGTGGVTIEGAMTAAALDTAVQETVQLVLPQIVQRMTAEALEEAWERLEQWRPSEGRTPAQNAGDLQAQYLGMKNQILALEPTDAGLQAELLTRLETLVIGHAERLLSGQYSPLTAFLEESGQASAGLAVRNSLLLFVMGRFSPQKPVWPQNFLQWEAQSTPAQGQRWTAQTEDYGMVHYGPGGKTDVRPAEAQTRPAGSVAPPAGRGARMAADPPLDLEGPTGVIITRTAKRDALPLRFPRPFTPAELEASNTFARHLRQHGMPGTAAAREPHVGPDPAAWVGVRAGVLWLKGEVFAEAGGVGKEMAQVMRNGVERLISATIRQATAETLPSMRDMSHLRRAELTRLDVVFLPFRAVVSDFQAHRNAKRAMMSGLLHLMDVLKQQEEGVDEPGTSARTRDQPGNQAGALWMPTERTKRWLQQIKSSWNQFRRDLGLRPDASQEFGDIQAEYSAWACALPPAETMGRGLRVSLPTLVGWCALAMGLAAAVLLLWSR